MVTYLSEYESMFEHFKNALTDYNTKYIQYKINDITDFDYTVLYGVPDFNIEIHYISACGMFIVDVTNTAYDEKILHINIDNNYFDSIESMLQWVSIVIGMHSY
jgi:hypothetical protein